MVMLAVTGALTKLVSKIVVISGLFLMLGRSLAVLILLGHCECPGVGSGYFTKCFSLISVTF